jgi:hypothetical protein
MGKAEVARRHNDVAERKEGKKEKEEEADIKNDEERGGRGMRGEVEEVEGREEWWSYRAGHCRKGRGGTGFWVERSSSSR